MSPISGEETLVCRQQGDSDINFLNLSHVLSRSQAHSGRAICACRLEEVQLKLLVSIFQEAWAAQDEGAAKLGTAAEVTNEASSITPQEGPAESSTSAGEQTALTVNMSMRAGICRRAMKVGKLSWQAEVAADMYGGHSTGPLTLRWSRH